MDIQTYNARAIPRLAAIDRLDGKCQWSKHLCEITPIDVQLRVAALRDQRERLMREQAEDELAAGL